VSYDRVARGGGVMCATAIALQRRLATSSTLSVGAFTLCGCTDAYGRHVSGAMENRAAVFTSKPQAVEVYQAGAWWSGELLGWRHAADGSCQVWVRVVLGGVEETAWTDLGTLRLPERHLAMAPEPASAASIAREMSVARHPSSRREHAAEIDASATTSLPAVRDLSVVPNGSAPSKGGRRRAPEVPAPSTGGRRRAPEESAAVSSGGRRRASEETQDSTGGRRRAPEAAVAAVSPSALPRHRAPGAPVASGDPGRHRTADTGLFPAVTEGAPPTVEARRAVPPTAEHNWTLPSARAARPEESLRGRPQDNWTAPVGLEGELLTRPMRLGDLAPNFRRPRPDGSLRSV
jgi:hypothetical protein